MKKLLASVCVVFAILAFSTLAYAEGFVVKSVEYPEGEKLLEESWDKYDHILMRYKDTKEPIALSSYYDGSVFATIPEEYKDRELEVFISEDLAFSDYSEGNYDYAFYPMTVLSGKGVVKGDEQGRANPHSDVTRAEATAMVMRYIGFSEFKETDSGFKDVPENEWYAPCITKARKLGIVKGDSEDTFTPDRSVTREEISVMAARAANLAGLINIKDDTTYDALKSEVMAEDCDKVSDWAVPYIYALKRFGAVLYEYTFDETKLDAEGAPISYAYINPQNKAERTYVAEVIMRIVECAQVYPSKIAKQYGFDKKMPVIDGSTSTYPFTEAVYSNLFSNGWVHKDKPQKHSKSHASYQRLINGEVDAIVASVYPADDIVKMAKDNGVELELVPIAYDAMIFFTNIDNPAENLTKQQITDIYVDNKYENWNQIGGPDALLYPYCRNNDSGSHAQMQRHFLNGKEINEKIRNETTSVSMSNVLTDVMDAETKDPVGYGLGYSIYYYFRNMDMFYDTSKTLKLLKIDGIAPTPETIADGTYPLSNNTYVVFRKGDPEDAVSRKFADFMLSELGQGCVEQAGFGPLKK